MSMFPKIRSNPWLKGLQFPECSGRRDTNNPPTTWQPSGQGLMAVVIWDLGSKEVTEALTGGPTSPRNQVVRKPKRTASLASRSYQGTPMLHVSHSSPFQRSRAQAEAPTSRSTTRGPPRSASARSTPAEGTQEGLGFWPPVSGHSICVSSIPRQTSRLTAWVLLPSFSLSGANFSPVAFFLRLLLVIPPTIFSHLGCGISPHSLLHFLLFKICVYFCHTAQHVGS